MRQGKVLVLVLVLAILSTKFSYAMSMDNLPMVKVSVGSAIPMDDFNDMYDPTFSLGGSILWKYISNIVFQANLDYASFKGEINKFDTSTNTYTDEKIEVEHNILDFTAGVKYLVVDKGLMPYVAIGAGIYNSNNKESITDFGIYLGGGVNYNVTKMLQADVTLLFNSIFTQYNNTNYFNLAIGLIYSF